MTKITKEKSLEDRLTELSKQEWDLKEKKREIYKTELKLMEKSQEVEEKEAVLQARHLARSKPPAVDRDERGLAKGLDDYLGLDTSMDNKLELTEDEETRRLMEEYLTQDQLNRFSSIRLGGTSRQFGTFNPASLHQNSSTMM